MDEHTNEPSESEMKEVESALNDISDKTPSLRRKPKLLSEKERERLTTSIASALSEFTDCYILLGFDVHGNAMLMINSANDLEGRALSDLVDEFVENGEVKSASDFDDED